MLFHCHFTFHNASLSSGGRKKIIWSSYRITNVTQLNMKIKFKRKCYHEHIVVRNASIKFRFFLHKVHSNRYRIDFFIHVDSAAVSYFYDGLVDMFGKNKKFLKENWKQKKTCFENLNHNWMKRKIDLNYSACRLSRAGVFLWVGSLIRNSFVFRRISKCWKPCFTSYIF